MSKPQRNRLGTPLSQTRVKCCVPFCNRTHRNDEGFREWICQRHWSLVSNRTRRWKKLSEKIARRASERFKAQYEEQDGYLDPQLDRAMAAIELKDKIWERCKREAMERAGGI